MNRRIGSVVLLVIAIAVLSGCGGPALQPFVFGDVPWSDGEVSNYAVLDRTGTEIGSASWSWQQAEGEWVQHYELQVAGRQDRGEVTMSSGLAPLLSWRELSGIRFETTYTGTITIRSTGSDGKTTEKSLALPADALDNDQTLQVQRALPLAEGYATRYTNVVPSTGIAIPLNVIVQERQEITTPAGTFEAWHVVMDYGASGQHDGWYGIEEPRLLLRYRNRAAGTEFVLTSWEHAGAGSPVTPGAVATVIAPESPEVEPGSSVVPLNLPFLLAALLVQYPLMLAAPLLLGWWIRRRYRISWGVFGAGALIFIASQVVHLPLNWLLGLLGGGRGVALWPLVPMAIVAGLSAGVCEEVARWIALRFVLRKTRGWASALQLGAGHGAVESIIFGVLALLTLASMLALRSLDPTTLGLSGVLADQARSSVAAYWQSPWYTSVLAGAERLMALAVHVAMTVLVMRAVLRRRIVYMLAAIGFHALVDFVAVWAVSALGAIWAEALLAPLALFALWLVIRLRESPDAIAVPEPAPSVPMTEELSPRSISADELARRVEKSKFE